MHLYKCQKQSDSTLDISADAQFNNRAQGTYININERAH